MSEVKFIRRRGKIIPIRSKKRKEEVKKSAAFITSGVATSFLAGKLSGESGRKAKFRGQMVMPFMQETSGAIPKTLKKKNIDKLRKLSIKSSSLGKFLGGFLIGEGIEKGIGNREDSIGKELISQAGGQISAQIISSQRRKAFGIRSSFKMPTAVKKISKDLASKFVKKQLRLKF